MPEMKLKPESWPVLAFIASAALIAGAHGFERIGHYLPCDLCLRQREIHWAAMAIAAAGLVIVRRWSAPRLVGAVNVLLFLIFMTSLVVATYHAGVEWDIFEGPSGCSSTAGGLDASTIPNMLPSLEDLNRPQGTVSCDVAAWRLFGISMAGYNALISLVLAAFSALFATKALASADTPSDPAY